MFGNIENNKRFFSASTFLSTLLLLAAPLLWAADTIESLRIREPFTGLASQIVAENAGDMPAVPAPAAVLPPAGEGQTSSAGALHTYFVDVGQGDCEYLELPNGKTVLIDGGPGNSTGVGDPPVAQFLTKNSITKIDYVVLTHPHADHYAGLDYVFSHVKVANFYDTREENPSAPTVKVLRDKISAMGVNVSYPVEGDSLSWDPGEVQAKVLHSCSKPGVGLDGFVLNDCSIVLHVTYQNTSLLFTGDVQADEEAQLVSKYGSQLRADVLKVGHHGSSGSSSAAFLNMVKPKAAYIAVGKGNSYGHPTQAALSRLQAAGAAIYRTDLGGTQEYTIGGNAYAGPLRAPAGATSREQQ